MSQIGTVETLIGSRVVSQSRVCAVKAKHSTFIARAVASTKWQGVKFMFLGFIICLVCRSDC